ncbi:hypothetical protein ACJIZ3_017773 [Penstemon smallii]|uniref:Uncharacterized protein n=1 Tax=Penstemon smallii TaxID=265156 RepID=A0ABD3SXB0_9LAMI
MPGTKRLLISTLNKIKQTTPIRLIGHKLIISAKKKKKNWNQCHVIKNSLIGIVTSQSQSQSVVSITALFKDCSLAPEAVALAEDAPPDIQAPEAVALAEDAPPVVPAPVAAQGAVHLPFDLNIDLTRTDLGELNVPIRSYEAFFPLPAEQERGLDHSRVIIKNQ